MRPSDSYLGNQRIHRPQSGECCAQQVAVEQANPVGLVDGGKYLVIAQPVAEIRTDAPAEIGSRTLDLEKARPSHYPCRIQRHVDGIVRRGLFQGLVQIMGSEIVDDVFRPDHGVAEAECAVGEFKGYLPAVLLPRATSD